MKCFCPLSTLLNVHLFLTLVSSGPKPKTNGYPTAWLSSPLYDYATQKNQ